MMGNLPCLASGICLAVIVFGGLFFIARELRTVAPDTISKEADNAVNQRMAGFVVSRHGHHLCRMCGSVVEYKGEQRLI